MTEPRPDARAPGDPTAADTTTAGTTAAGDDLRVARTRGLALTEDWAATLVGLLILAAVLAGLWPGWLVP